MTQYVQFTNRIPITYAFEYTDKELEVYDLLQDLLLSSAENSTVFPRRQRHLLLMILCKLMGSSIHAIVYTLESILQRLLSLKEQGSKIDLSDIADEIAEEEYDGEIEDDNEQIVIVPEELEFEICRVSNLIEKAKGIKEESKYLALKEAIAYAFDKLEELGAEKRF